MMQRKKHAVRNYLAEDPTPQPGQIIARVLVPRGNHLHEVKFPDGTVTLAELPTKFRSIIWVKRDSYVIIDPFPVDAESGRPKGKIGGEIVYVLFQEHINTLRKTGQWPVVWDEEYPTEASSATAQPEDEEVEDQGDDDGDESDSSIFRNPNKSMRAVDSTSEDEDDSEEEFS